MRRRRASLRERLVKSDGLWLECSHLGRGGGMAVLDLEC
jgi:hypothetical protein